MTDVTLMLGNCLDRLKDLDDNSVDSIVTDPPYGIDFMGKKWDYDVPSTEIWEQALRVLKPGGYLLAFAGTRTQHRMAVRIEDAGFEIRDMIAWVYGSGFPKSLNVSKAIDATMLTGKSSSKALSSTESKRPVIGKVDRVVSKNRLASEGESDSGVKKNRERFHETETKKIAVTSALTDEAKKWEGWGTALKPALEPITVARKPLGEKTVAANVLKYGTGGINIDASRVETNQEITNHSRGKESAISKGKYGDSKVQETHQTEGQKLGRFPANLIHDGSEEVTDLFPHTKSGKLTHDQQKNTGFAAKTENPIYGRGSQTGGTGEYESNEGSAARFFYVPKTSKKDRNDGAENNNHPTVKPTDLMRYLVTMVTPKGGTTLDPFMGSGSTGRGAKLGGVNFVGIELDPEYFVLAKARIDAIMKESTLEDFFSDE